MCTMFNFGFFIFCSDVYHEKKEIFEREAGQCLPDVLILPVLCFIVMFTPLLLVLWHKLYNYLPSVLNIHLNLLL